MWNALTRVIRLLCCVGLVVGMSGCHLWPFMANDDGRKVRDLGKADQIMYPYAPPPVHLSEGYGHAFHAARDNQILHPEASENLDVVTEKNGNASYRSIELYRKSFTSPPFGTSSSSSGGKK